MSTHRYTIRNAPARSRGFGIVGIIKLLLLFVLIAGTGWLLLRQTVHDRLAKAVLDKLRAHAQPLGVESQLTNAQFREGAGLTLDNLQLSVRPVASAATVERSQLSIPQLTVHSASSLTDLISGRFMPQAIELHHAKLTIVRGPDGSLDLSPLIDQLANLPRPAGQSFPPVVLKNCEVNVADLSGQFPDLRLSDINFSIATVTHQGASLVHIHGELRTPIVSKIGVSVFFNPQDQSWSAQVSADQASVSQNLIASLPSTYAGHFAELENLAGLLSFTAEAAGTGLQQIPNFELSGRLEEFSLDDRRLPVPLRQCSASFLVNNDGIKIHNVGGRMDGKSRFQLGYIQAGLASRDAWRCHGTVTNFVLNRRPRLESWLTGYCKRFCMDFSPIGEGDLSFDFSDDGQQLKKTIVGTLHDMSFSFIKMPYRVDHCHGRIKIENSHCDFDIRSELNGQPIGLDGYAGNLGGTGGPMYRVNLRVPGDVRIDEKLLTAAAAQPKLAEVVNSFAPTGLVGGFGVIERPAPGAPVSKQFQLHAKDCSVRHEHFDYPIYQINGNIIVQNSNYQFENLTGRNSSGRVSCNGKWNPTEGLNLDLRCRGIPLNNQLRMALKPDIREIWDGFRPRGVVDQMDVQLLLPPGQRQVDVSVQAVIPEADNDGNSVSIYPVWFPYQIEHLAGKINIGDGRIRLTDMNGRHNTTTIACQGQGHYSYASWSLRLNNLLVNSLKVDGDLLAAVPRSMAGPLAQLRFTGLANVNGQVTLAGTKHPNDFTPVAAKTPASRGPNRSTVQLASYASNDIDSAASTARPTRSSMAWDVMINMNQADMLVGLPLKNVFGGVRLTGIYDGENIDCDGQLDLDSMIVYDNQITNVTGPFKIENHRVSAGVFTEQFSQNRRGISPIQSTPQQSTATSLSGILHEGVVRLDAQMNSNAPHDFFVQGTLADASLATACQEFAPDLEHVSGHAFAGFRMRGDGSGTHSHRGEGSIQLRDAKIYELPVFVALIKILNVRQLTRTAFDTGDIDFQILGERIIFDRMEFIGDAISLIGDGEMNLDWDIDLNFYSVMGRNRFNIPLISELYRKGSRRTLAIKIDGKLDAPQTHKRVLPELNENLNRLFSGRNPDLSRRLLPPPPPSLNSQPVVVGESFFDPPSNGPLQFPNGLER